MIICRTRQAHSQERWEACSSLRCVKLPKIPWYFCQDILGFRLVSCKIQKPIFPHSTEKSGEILSRFGLLISWNIQGIYILGFSHGIFQYSLDITMDIQSKYRNIIGILPYIHRIYCQIPLGFSFTYIIPETGKKDIFLKICS